MEDRHLFKAKRIDNGEWVIGNLVFSVYCKNDVCVGQYENKIGMHEVNPHTICQCTGLKDKNGKLIWENDIIKCRLGEAIILWNEAEWKIKKHDDFIWYKDLYYWVISDRNFEVIGNIFDNKDLLESEDKNESNH